MNFFAQLLDATNIPKTTADKGHLNSVFNIVLGTMGALAFLILILAGFRYAISQGEPEKMASARRSIAYAIIGLVVIAFAAVIVNFVLART